MKFNTRGFSLIEMVSAVTLISILSVFSVTQYNRSKTKSFTKEAQLQLGHLHRMQAIYHSENNTFTFELSGNMFPKGILLYNVGFGGVVEDFKTNPCGTFKVGRTASAVNNYYELCGDDLDTTGHRPECGFRNKSRVVPTNSQYRTLQYNNFHMATFGQRCTDNTRPHLSDVTVECVLSVPGLSIAELDKYRREKALEAIEDKAYRKYIAYAVGDILDPRNFSTTNLNELDVWRINGNGFLEHCSDPLDNTTSNNCNSTMGKTEDDSSQYCD